MRRSLPVLALVCVLTLSACAGGGPRAGSAEPHAETCDELVERYRATLAGATGSCASDQECVVYGGLDPEAVCGGAIDTATGRALAAIGDESDAAGCPRPGYGCSAIEPHCVDGRCR